MNTPTRRNALDRGLEILSLLAKSGPLNFSAIANHCGAANAVLSRLLRALTAQGWIEHQQDGRYGPGPQLRALQPDHDPLKQIQPILNALRDTTACTCLLLVEEHAPAGPYVRCAAKAAHEEGLGMQDVGAIRCNYLNHPWSWIFLNEHDAAHTNSILKTEDPATWLQNAWQQGVTQLRKQGWCQLCTGSNSKLAFPVKNRMGTLVACLGLGWPGSPPQGQTMQRLYRAMSCAATELAKICTDSQNKPH